MTTIGHSLTGLSLAVLTLPHGQSRRWYLLTTVLFVVFANLSDFPLPGWGHYSYHVSHSVFVTALLASLMSLLLLLPTFHARGSEGDSGLVRRLAQSPATRFDVWARTRHRDFLAFLQRPPRNAGFLVRND